MPERFRFTREIRTSFTAGKTRSRFPAKPENGKPHQEQSQAAHAKFAPAARRSSAGRLPKRAGNGCFRQMAAIKNRTRLMVYRVLSSIGTSKKN